MSALYNHSLHFLTDQYEGNYPKQIETISNGGLYGARVLACTTAEDVVQLDPRLRENYAFMRDYLGEAGLSVATEVIWDTAVEVARDHPNRELSVYSYHSTVDAVRPDSRRLEALNRFDDKNDFVRHCIENGYPVPRTVMADGGELPDFSELTFPVYVKAARSSSGSNIFKCSTYDDVIAGIKEMGSRYQIQEEVPDVQAFLNVQYQSNGEAATHLETTEQILNGFSHAGNRCPSVFDPRDLTDPLANELVKLGLRDIFAFDVAVTPNGMLLIECNARWNGSSYPTKAASQLAIPEWTAINARTSLERPQDINMGSLAYDQASKVGVLMLSSGLMAAHRKVNLLLAGTPDEQQILQAALPGILRS